MLTLPFVFATVIVAAATTLALYTAYIWWKRQQINLPNPAYSNFFLANGTELRKFDIFVFLNWAKKYGPVYQCHLYHYTFVFAADYRWIREFCNNSRFPKSSMVYEKLLGNLFGLRVMGYGLVTITKQSEWLKHRMLLNPAFHKTALLDVASTFNEYGDRMVARLKRAAATNESVNIWDVFGRVAMDIISKTAFGMSTDMLNDPAFTLRHCIYMYFKGENHLFVDPMLQLRPSKASFVREVKQCCRTLRDVGHRCIAERFGLLVKDPSSVPNDALTMLLRGSLGDDKQLKDSDLEWIIDEFITLFVAGHETTALTLAVTMYELSRHPEIYEKAMTEIKTVTQGRDALTSDDISNLKYIECILKESLRIYPPAPATVRVVPEKSTVCGVDLPANTEVVLSFFTAHMWPDYFENPTEFIPERFESEEGRYPGSYAPFSLGPRICLGKDFAMIEAKLLLTKILKNFTYTIQPEPKFELEAIATLRLKNGLFCNFTERIADK